MRPLIALAILDAGALLVGGVAVVGPFWPLAAHAAIVATAFLLWWRSGRAPGLAGTILGLAGPAGILVAVLLDRNVAPRIRDDDAIFGPRAEQGVGRGAGAAVARMLDGRVHFPAASDVQSLVTVMRHGDIAARRLALETTVRSFEPALSPLIALALTDDDQTIRALAAAASARVVDKLAVERARAAQEADGDRIAAAAASLADHARANVLLSDAQRAHLRDDALATMPADGTARDGVLLEALWAAGDYAAIDRLTAPLARGADDDDAAALARWWQAGATA